MSVADLRERKNQFITSRHRRRDGSMMDVEIVGVYVNQDDREYSFAYVRDITSRRQEEAKLQAAYEQITATEEELRAQYEELAQSEKRTRESEEKYHSLVELSPVAVIVHRDGKILYANPEALRLAGTDREEDVVGREVIAFVHPDDRAMAMEDFRLLFTEGKIIPLKEERLVRISGKPFTVEITAMPIQYQGTAAALVVFRDITDRKRTEEKLREQYEALAAARDELQRHQQQLEEITGTVPGVVFQFYARPDGTMGLYHVSDRAQEILGISSNLADFFERFTLHLDSRDQEAFLHSVKKAVENKTAWDFTGRFIRPTGETIWIQGISRPNEHGDELVFSGFLLDITERRQAEDEIRLLKISADSSSDEVFWLDFTGRILYVNDAACRATGYSRGDLAGMKIFELDPDFPPEVWGASVADLRERKTQFITTKHRRKDGSIMDVEIVTVYVSQEDQEYSFAYVRDITGRKKIEAEIQRSNNFTRALLDAVPTPVFYKNRDGRYLGCNRAFTEIMGVTSEEIAGKTVFDLWPGELSRIYHQKDLELMQNPQHQTYESSVCDREGKNRPVIYAKDVFSDGSGQIAGIVGAFLDITGLKQTEQALRENEEQYRTLVESSFDGIAIHQDGILVYVNRTAARLLGSEDPGVFIGKPAIGLVAPAYRHQILERVQQAPESSQELIREQFLRLDGTLIDVDVTTTPSTWKGRPAAYVTFRDITAQLQAETALRESEEKYRELVEHSRDGVFIVQDGRLVFYNRALVGLTGYTAEELNGRHLADLIAPEDREMVMARARDRAGGNVVPELYEFSLLHKDGTGRTRVRTRAGLGTYKGRPASIGTFYDVTEDRRREEALRESEEKFRALVETTSDFIWEVDAAGAYSYVSPNVRDMLGYEPGELVGKTPFALMPPDEAARVAAEYSRCAAARLPIAALENKALRKDGSVVILETSGVVRTGKDGTYQGYRGIDRDITLRKQTEEALREKTEELNRYFTASLDLFCIADTEGFFRRLNPQWERTLGYTLSELEGKRFLDFVHPDDLPATLAAVSDLSSQKEVINFTNRYRHRDGTYRWIEWRSIPGGNLIFAAARDITARHEADKRTAVLNALKQALLMTGPLEEKLQRITDCLVETFGADFARIWIAGPGDLCGKGCIHAPVTEGPGVCQNRASCLHLIVSSGRYTHTDGGHRRVPFGAYKIGRIATGEEARFITDDVMHDPRVHDHAWAGSLGLVSFCGFRLLSPEGDPIGVLAFFSRQPVNPAVVKDLDDLATTASQVIQTGMAEQALRESEARLSSILHSSPVLQFVIDRNHRVISWNRALEEYSGITAAEIIGTDQQWRAFYPEKRPVLADTLVDGDSEALSRFYAEKFTKSRYVEGAYEATDFFPHMGSSGTWLSFTAAPIRDDGGIVIGAVETLEDVTERRTAENTIREREEWTRTILDTAQAGIVLVDATTHRIVDANKKALELIGLDRESVIGVVCHRFICPAEVGHCPVTDHGQTVDTSERILINAAGEKIPVLKTVVPASIRGRSVLVESFVDIAEQKRSESAIREANRKLNLLNSITRHDIRNQLTVAQGYTQLAALSKPDETVTDFLAKISAAIETIQRQIEFTKTYQELGVHAPAWFSVAEIITMARPGTVALRTTCGAAEIFADPMIDKVFFNLFDNAVKHGTQVTTVTAGCGRKDTGLVITFADNGCGIPQTEKEKIFEKGYGKNTGLGLFLAREILAITGITIRETGTPGEGAVFEITVPEGAYRNAD